MKLPCFFVFFNMWNTKRQISGVFADTLSCELTTFKNKQKKMKKELFLQHFKQDAGAKIHQIGNLQGKLSILWTIPLRRNTWMDITFPRWIFFSGDRSFFFLFWNYIWNQLLDLRGLLLCIVYWKGVRFLFFAHSKWYYMTTTNHHEVYCWYYM